MSDLIRDAPIGQLIRFFTKNTRLQYREENSDFKCPNCYKNADAHSDQYSDVIITEPLPTSNLAPVQEGKVLEEKADALEEVADPVASSDDGDASSTNSDGDNTAAETDVDITKIDTHKEEGHDISRFESIKTQRTGGLSRVGTRSALQQSTTRADLEQQYTNASLARGPTQPIEPVHLEDGTILVDWYDTDDPENPQNWSPRKKIFVSLQIYLYTFAVYMGSAIYTPSVEGVMERFHVSAEEASLGLSMYVLAYGIGPLLFSPLSEIPRIGRNPPYMITFAIFVILLVPTALVDNFAGLVVLRFLQGFFGSPCLATGGASLGDIWSLIKLPYVLSLWAFAATCGPALGPIISGFSVAAENWRWSLWEMLWLAGPIWISLFFFLPETSPSTILLRRAQRLREITGDTRLKAQSEIDQASLNFKDVAVEALWVPIKTILLDPAIAFTAIYTALIYGIFYSFFEAFPLVYMGMYGFNLGEVGLTFLSITVGVTIAIIAYWSYIYWIVEPEIRSNGLGAPERRLIPALISSVLLPVGLFIFAWTSNPSIHWIASIVGVAVFTIGIFLVIQCIFLYLPLTYPQYAASLFAGNDFVRSTLAAGTIHFSRPLYLNLGVDRGVSLLAGLTCGCIAGVFVLYFMGAKLRAKSRFAAK